MSPRVIGGPAWRSWSCAHAGDDTVTAFGESCRRSGHVLTARFDPQRSRRLKKQCGAAKSLTCERELMEYRHSAGVTAAVQKTALEDPPVKLLDRIRRNEMGKN